MSISDLKELNDTYIEEKQLVHNKGQQRLLLLGRMKQICFFRF